MENMDNAYINNTNHANRKRINQLDFVKPKDLNVTTENYNLTLFLAVFLGVFGVHRFVNKKYVTGLIMFFTLGGFTIWSLVDVYLIVSRKFKNSKGQTLIYGGEFYQHAPNILAICLTMAIFGGWINFSSTDSATTSEIPQDAVSVEEKDITEAPIATQEVPVVETTGEKITAVGDSYAAASADLAGTYSDKSYNPKSDVIIENASFTPTSEKENYNVGFTLTSNNSEASLTNIVLRITIMSKEDQLSSRISSECMNEVLEPGESVDFVFNEYAYGEPSFVGIELISYEIVK